MYYVLSISLTWAHHSDAPSEVVNNSKNEPLSDNNLNDPFARKIEALLGSLWDQVHEKKLY
jgi:hypothetical protein